MMIKLHSNARKNIITNHSLEDKKFIFCEGYFNMLRKSIAPLAITLHPYKIGSETND